MCDSPYLSDAVHDLKGHRYSSLSGQPHELTGVSRRADEEMSGTTATYRDAISSWSSRGDPHFTEGDPAGDAKEWGGGEWLIANAAVAAQRDGEWHYPCGAWYPVPAAGIVASAEPSGC